MKAMMYTDYLSIFGPNAGKLRIRTNFMQFLLFILRSHSMYGRLCDRQNTDINIFQNNSHSFSDKCVISFFVISSKNLLNARVSF